MRRVSADISRGAQAEILKWAKLGQALGRKMAEGLTVWTDSITSGLPVIRELVPVVVSDTP